MIYNLSKIYLKFFFVNSLDTTFFIFISALKLFDSKKNLPFCVWFKTRGSKGESVFHFVFLAKLKGASKWIILFILPILVWERFKKWFILFILFMLCFLPSQEGSQYESFYLICSFYVSCQVDGESKWFVLFILCF